MKTTIDIPEPLYKKAKIQAIEQKSTLKQIVLAALERALDEEHDRSEATDAPKPYFARRKLLPEFARLQRKGAFRPKPGDRDITKLISDDRDGC